MSMKVKKFTTLLTLDARRTIADFRNGWKQGKISCKEFGSKGLASDVFICSKAIYKNLKNHNNLITAPICVAAAMIPGGTVLLVPVVLKRAVKGAVKSIIKKCKKL